jgi:hypothetical protein
MMLNQHLAAGKILLWVMGCGLMACGTLKNCADLLVPKVPKALTVPKAPKAPKEYKAPKAPKAPKEYKAPPAPQAPAAQPAQPAQPVTREQPAPQAPAAQPAPLVTKEQQAPQAQQAPKAGQGFPTALLLVLLASGKMARHSVPLGMEGHASMG